MRKRGFGWPLFAFVAGAVIASRRVDLVEVRGHSMAPTLLPGDQLLVVRAGPPRVGDVVLARDPTDSARELIKRVACVDASGVSLHGDNPAASADARAFGTVPSEEVRWRAVARYWPPRRIGHVPGR